MPALSRDAAASAPYLMPLKPRRPCPTIGCPELTDGGPCEAHRKQRQRAHDAQRGTAHERGYTSQWARYARQFKQRFPLCGTGPAFTIDQPSPWGCLRDGRYVAAEHVDHIIPVNHGGEFWDQRNHQALCQSCHSRKTRSESVAVKSGTHSAASRSIAG